MLHMHVNETVNRKRAAGNTGDFSHSEVEEDLLREQQSLAQCKAANPLGRPVKCQKIFRIQGDKKHRENAMEYNLEECADEKSRQNSWPVYRAVRVLLSDWDI